MGCDIHTHVERQDGDGDWRPVAGQEPFRARRYGIFGFLADVRNYSAVPPIAEERGLPDDVSATVKSDHVRWGFDAHSATWLLVSELAEFDYDRQVNDRRITRDGDGGVTGIPEEGSVMTYREFLGRGFMEEIEKLKALGAPDRHRVVMWFDN